MKRFTLTVSQKSAEGKVGHAVGEDIEAAWLEPSDSWKKSVSWKTASRHSSESMPTNGLRGHEWPLFHQALRRMWSTRVFYQLLHEGLLGSYCTEVRTHARDGVSRAVEERLFRAA